MAATKFGPRWSLPLLVGHPGNPRQLLIKDGTSNLDTSVPYPFLFYLETSWGRVTGKQHFPSGWGSGCGVRTMDLALSIGSLWEISTHINRAQLETQIQNQLAHIKGAVIKLYKLSTSAEGEILRQVGLEMLQPHWIEFYSCLYNTLWARCMFDSEEGSRNTDVCIIAGTAFKRLSDLNIKLKMTLDRDALTLAKQTFELCLLGLVYETRKLPFEKSSEEAKAGAHSYRLGRQLIMGMKPTPFTKKCIERFDRLKSSGWEESAEYTVPQLKDQLNEWVSSNFDNADITLPSTELKQ
jgi:hypothetical protein|tara:strand:- start:3206 stop:4093 length:888 start_codon:yes stop_codon:yes gene_type:complete